MDKFLLVSNKTSALLASKIGPDGILKDSKVSDDLCSQNKLVTLLYISGHTLEAHRVLDRIKRDFMQVQKIFYKSFELIYTFIIFLFSFIFINILYFIKCIGQ